MENSRKIHVYFLKREYCPTEMTEITEMLRMVWVKISVLSVLSVEHKKQKTHICGEIILIILISFLK